jgi:Fe-S-cluster-containing dehydrogenase component
VDAIMTNDQGIVLVIKQNCIGCRVCVDACPFGAMAFDEGTALAMNCDVCVHRLAVGKEPACMSICPTRCITLTGSRKSVAAVFEHRVA